MNLVRRRLLSALVDGITVTAAYVVLALVSGSDLLSISDPAGNLSWPLLAATLVVAVPATLGRPSLGKRLVGTVPTLPPGFTGRLRMLSKYIALFLLASVPFQPYILLLAAVTSCALTGGQRTVLDLIAGTGAQERVVVHEEKVSAQ